MPNTIDQLSSRLLNNIGLWAKESILRTFLVVVFFTIVVIPTIGKLQTAFNSINFPSIFQSVWQFITSNVSTNELILYIITTTNLVLIALLFLKHNSLSKIEDKFENLDKWSLPLDSTWSIKKVDDSYRKVLSISDSYYPGTLKPTFGWYDYEITFEAKINSDSSGNQSNISIMIRSDNNLDGLVLELDRRTFKPYFLKDGNYILDDLSVIKLPSIIENNEWIAIIIKVHGNNVNLSINRYELTYNIPTFSITTKSDSLYAAVPSEVTRSKIKAGADLVEEFQTKQYKMWEEFTSMPSGDERSTKENEWHKYLRERPQTTTLNIDYQKGSIGFRNKGSLATYYRKLLVIKK